MDSSLVYLVQTQTTVGILSQDSTKLAKIKQRPASQKMLCEVDSFKTLLQHTRVPKKYRKMVRNSKNTTFIYPNGESFRVVDKNSAHYDFIKKFGVMYSTSANITGKDFDEEWAKSVVDVIVEDSRGFSQNQSSSIIKLTANSMEKIR